MNLCSLLIISSFNSTWKVYSLALIFYFLNRCLLLWDGVVYVQLDNVVMWPKPTLTRVRGKRNYEFLLPNSIISSMQKYNGKIYRNIKHNGYMLTLLLYSTVVLEVVAWREVCFQLCILIASNNATSYFDVCNSA